MGEWRDNFDKGMKKAFQKASMLDNAPSPVDFKQMLKNSTDIEKKGKQHPGKTCDEAHPGKTCEEWRNTKEDEVDEATGAGSAGGFVAPLFTEKKKKKKEEVGEATDASSSGQYSTPKIWAKNEKNWRGKQKTQWPGGKFVKVKEKCKTFPYCNQGDIDALELTENKIIKKAIEEISKKTGKDKTHIKNLVAKEIEEIISRSFYKSPVTDKDTGIVGVGKMDTPIGKMYSIGGKKNSK
jgi:hypothetical protein